MMTPDPERVQAGMEYERANPEPPEWLQEYCDYTPTLNRNVTTPQDAINSIDWLIEELQDFRTYFEEINNETTA